jgi:hypothetical protein
MLPTNKWLETQLTTRPFCSSASADLWRHLAAMAAYFNNLRARWTRSCTDSKHNTALESILFSTAITAPQQVKVIATTIAEPTLNAIPLLKAVLTKLT